MAASAAAAHRVAGDTMKKVLIALFLLGILVTQALGASDDGLIPVPPLKERVTDLTGTLTNEEKAALTAKLAAFEKASGSQIAVLIIPTTKPEEIEQYSIRVAEQWKLGRKGIADGILLLVAKDDHKMRIEVGYGLEGAIPDAIAKRIISEIISPEFKKGNYYSGVDAGIGSMIRIIGGEQLPPPQKTSNSTSNNINIIGIWLAVFFVGVWVATFLQMIFGKLIGSVIVSGIVGIIGWVVMGTIIATVIAGIIGFIVALWVDSDNKGRGLSSGKGSNNNSSPKTSSNSDSGWSSSSSSDSFSGGGGDFGGGGASGDW